MATDIADALVQVGVPFRDAHHRVGALVQKCSADGTELESLSDMDWATLVPELTMEQVRKALDPIVSLQRRNQPGSPAPNRVEEAQVRHLASVSEIRARVVASRADTEIMGWLRDGSVE